MAMNEDAVLTAATGYIYTAPVGTAAPTPADITAFDPAVGFTGWENIGHTSRDELPEFGFDGGDSEVKGTWQNASLREVVTEVASDYVVFNVHQFDDNALGLYYGADNASTTPGVFGVANAPTGTVNRALLIVIVDGDVNLGFHAERVSIKRDDSIELASDEFAYMPLRATFVKNTGAALLFSWISEDTGIGAAEPVVTS